MRILSVEEFNGGLFVIAQYADLHQYFWWWVKDAADLLLTIPLPDVITLPGGGTATPPPSSPENKAQTTVGFRAATYFSTAPPTNMTIEWIYLLKPTSSYNFTPGPTQDAWMLIPETGTSGGRPTGVITIPYPGDNGALVAAEIMDKVNSTVTTPKVLAQAATANQHRTARLVRAAACAVITGRSKPRGNGARIPRRAIPTAAHQTGGS